MALLTKNKAMYVKACVIQNGVADVHGDLLNTQDIKKIFTSYNNQNSFEINHNNIPIDEVSLLENYISKTDETIGTTTVPSGSWNVVIRVDNPQIQESILDGTFGGISLYNRVKSECACNLKGRIAYAELKDMECMIPTFISFVDEGANQVGLHVMDYEAYVAKSKNLNIGDGKLNIIEELKAIIQKAETDEPVVAKSADSGVDDSVKDDEPKKDDESVVAKDCNKEDDGEPVADEDTTIQKDDEPTDEPAEDKTIEDEVEALKKEVAELKEIIKELTKKDEPKKDDEPVTDDGETDEPIVTKSARTIITDDTTTTLTNKNYYEMTGRDPLTGSKLKDKSKILN